MIAQADLGLTGDHWSLVSNEREFQIRTQLNLRRQTGIECQFQFGLGLAGLGLPSTHTWVVCLHGVVLYRPNIDLTLTLCPLPY